MKIETVKLLEDLKEISISNISAVKAMNEMDLKTLNWREQEGKWSKLECIEHLNRYGKFYIPEIKNRIENSKSKYHNIFKSGIIGNYFAQSMRPTTNMKKMKTFKTMNPEGSKLDYKNLETFLVQQNEILEILELCKSKNLTKIKTAISISPWIKIRLGDTLRVLIYHNLRHIKQAQNVVVKST